MSMDRKHNKDIVSVAKMLRKNMTKEEKHLWYDFLSMYPIRFSRQKVLGKYVVDFYCAKAKLIIELDGSQHYTQKGLISDIERTSYLNQYGLQVIRIANEEVANNFDNVCEYIDHIVRQSVLDE